jgi:hypothetical protein
MGRSIADLTRQAGFLEKAVGIFQDADVRLLSGLPVVNALDRRNKKSGPEPLFLIIVE